MSEGIPLYQESGVERRLASMPLSLFLPLRLGFGFGTE